MSNPRLMISAIKSGAGKTTITCGLLRTLQKMNLNPSAFKCGPDYIDPLFHSTVIGAKGCNLDLFFTEKEVCKQLFCEYAEGSDIAIVEGVMGFYDGLSGSSMQASAQDVSNTLDIPVVLAIDVKGAALTIAAIVKGLQEFAPNHIKGVILNNCSKMMYPMYQSIIEEHCNVKVYGYVPHNVSYAIESRHLGLVTADEITDLEQKLDLLADTMLESLDLEGLLFLARDTKEISYTQSQVEKVTDKSPRLAIARDRAFCFYYRENLDLLQKLGVELVEFSPLEDACLPDNIQGIYIGGGYPELYLEKLSSNHTMKASIKEAIAAGVVTFAECGGFMYLQEQIDGYDMVGAISGNSENIHKLSRFGYCTLSAKQDTVLCAKGEEIRAHEFHYYDSTNNGDSFFVSKPKSKRSWEASIATDTLLAGYPHLYFYANKNFAKHFVGKM
ncbi:MAG: cobyrinate a,c-diamide synthase [Lachnospiraceae bacterium]